MRDTPGEGPVAPDGSPVELYAALGPRTEAATICSAIGPRSTILELGCGTGRITRALCALGHDVTGVDESAEMLARGPGQALHSRIEDLHLDRTFDAVVLMSYLVNVPSPETRAAFLRCCATHLCPGGTLVLQRHHPDFLSRPIDRVSGHNRFIVRDIDRRSDGIESATLEWHINGRHWSQHITVQVVDDDLLFRVLDQSCLQFDDFLTEDRTWVRAVKRG